MMTTKEMAAAVSLAKSKQDLSNEDINIFDGFGLKDFAAVFVTVAQVARLIRWQAGTFSGGWDSEAINEIASFGKRRFNIIG